MSLEDGYTVWMPGESVVDLRALWRLYAAERIRDSREAVSIFDVEGVPLYSFAYMTGVS